MNVNVIKSVIQKPLQQLVADIIDCVPFGKVACYGQIADILASEHEIFMRGQIVGWTMSAMKKNEKYNDVAWQRIVAKTGQIVTHKLGMFGALQERLLKEEGILLDADGRIDMSKHCISTTELMKLYENKYQN
jgi:alkylated DNA nucleotide flippase Atl1